MSENYVITAVCERIQARISNFEILFQIYEKWEAKKPPTATFFNLQPMDYY